MRVLVAEPHASRGRVGKKQCVTRGPAGHWRAFFVSETDHVNRKPPILRAGLPSRPRRSAATISRMGGASATTGSLATFATRRPIHVRSAEGTGAGKGAAGKWTDAATGEHGDLLDVIRESCGLVDFRDVARRGSPVSQPAAPRSLRRHPGIRSTPAPTGSPESARRLFAMSKPIRGTIAETYLRNRGISALHRDCQPPLPSTLLLPARRSDAPTETWPALIAARHRPRRRHHRRRIAPGSIRPATRQGADRHAATRDGSPARQRRSLRRGRRRAGRGRRHRDHAVAALCVCRPCRWPPHSRPTTSPPCCSREPAPTLYRRATPMPAGDAAHDSSDRSAQHAPASRRSRCRRGSATSTRICTSSASMPFGQPCGFSSPRKMLTASCCRRPASSHRPECA